MSPADHPTVLRSGDASRPSLLGQITRGLSVLLSLAVLIALAGGGIAALHLRAAAGTPQAPAPPVSVATTRVEIVDGYELAVSYVGRLEPARRTAMAFERGGLVLSVAADEGDRIRAGDVLARLDTAQLAAGRRQLEARRTELEAQMELAKLTLGRQSRLKVQGWSPEQRLDEAETTVRQLTAAIEQVAAQIASIDIDLAKSELKAPFDGRIAARSIDEGAVVATGTPVLTLLEADRQQARIGLPPDIARTLDPAATYAIRAGDRTLSARLAARRPDIETGTRTVTVLFDIVVDGTSPGADVPASAGEQAVLGDLVTLDLATRIETRGAWLPLAALKEGRRGLWTVLVVDPAGGSGDQAVVRPEAVEVLHARAGAAFVRGTIRTGDSVVSGGTDRVVAGQRVALARQEPR